MSKQNQVSVSTQWVIAYHNAILKAWKEQDFKEKLINFPHDALKVLDFDVPENITIKFSEVNSNDFSNFPIQSLSLFDVPQSVPVLFKVPILPIPSEVNDSLEYISSLSNVHKLDCCCFCF